MSVNKTSEFPMRPGQKYSSRIPYLDNLRVLLTVLVVLHHTAITYGASGSWYYYASDYEGITDSLTSVLLTILTAINSSFFLAAFFLLSGYFTPGSYERRGSLFYFEERLIRLGIPLLIHITIIGPFINYFRNIMIFGADYSFWDYYTWFLKNGTPEMGPLWFIYALLIFAIGYTISRIISTRFLHYRIKDTLENKEHQQKKFPHRTTIFVLIALVGFLTFIVRIFIPSDTIIYYLPLGDFVSYISMFILGIVAYRQDWLSKISESQGKFWLKVVIGSIIFLLVFIFLTGAFERDISVFQGGFRWESLLGSIWTSIMCFSICISLLSIFREKLNNQRTFARFLSQNAYTVYIIHAPVLVVTSISLSDLVLHPLVKFVCVLCITLTLCFTTSHFLLRRIPGAKRVVG